MSKASTLAIAAPLQPKHRPQPSSDATDLDYEIDQCVMAVESAKQQYAANEHKWNLARKWWESYHRALTKLIEVKRRKMAWLEEVHEWKLRELEEKKHTSEQVDVYVSELVNTAREVLPPQSFALLQEAWAGVVSKHREKK